LKNDVERMTRIQSGSTNKKMFFYPLHIRFIRSKSFFNALFWF